ncbi:uncharacterized protein VTP21DRAFT_402 [Calcarisporiella thermophila]|uniref:uncharacterized protein n=1 Tax=Calcarisporiella thermophila TaxID=911321 RepID=UPI003741EC66
MTTSEFCSSTSYFDSASANYNTRPIRNRIASKAANAILERLPLHNFRLLDFGCGTGLLSQRLAEHTSYILGVDTSPRMIEEFNRICWENGVTPEEMRAVCLDISSTEIPPELTQEPLFDCVVTLQALHHIRDVTSVLKSLSRHISSGGWFAGVDLRRKEEYGSYFLCSSSTNSHSNVYHRGGFTPEELEDALIGAGFVDIIVETAFVLPKQIGQHLIEFEFVIAIGRKP